MKSLDDFLAYENLGLVMKFSQKQNISINESTELFGDLKMWIWFLGQRPKNSSAFPVYPEQGIIDEYWHEFILSTKDYCDFCRSFVGRYVHHEPSDFHAEGHRATLDEITLKSETLRVSMLEVAEALGVPIMRRWYEEFPRKYFFNKLREKENSCENRRRT